MASSPPSLLGPPGARARVSVHVAQRLYSGLWIQMVFSHPPRPSLKRTSVKPLSVNRQLSTLDIILFCFDSGLVRCDAV